MPASPSPATPAPTPPTPAPGPNHRAPESYDPAEPLEINRYAPASHADLAIAQAIRELAVAPAAEEAWAALRVELFERPPATRAEHARLNGLFRDLAAPPPSAEQWAERSAAILTPLAAEATRFAAQAAQLSAQTRALPVPAPTHEQWQTRAEFLAVALTARKRASDRLESITRDEPVRPKTSNPDDRQADWNALEATLRQGRHEPPPPVAPQRWDRMWNRIQTGIAPAAPTTGATPPPAAPTPPASQAADQADATSTARPSRTLRRSWGFFHSVVAAAALVVIGLGLWQLRPGARVEAHPHQRETAGRPVAPVASLASAQILDMGETDRSVTSVVRTTSGNHPVTVVVIVNQ